jgi:hypothetical protein
MINFGVVLIMIPFKVKKEMIAYLEAVEAIAL